MFDNTRIYVHGDVTTAVECGHMFDGIALIKLRYPFVDLDWLVYQKRFLLPDKIVATVTCHPEDQYDAETGVREAKRKLARKIVERRERAVERFEDWMTARMEDPAPKQKEYLEDY